MPAQIKQKDFNGVFLTILAISFLLHGIVLIGVQYIKLPPPPSQEEYANWVKKVAAPRRATLVEKPLPKKEIKQEIKHNEDAQNTNTVPSNGPSTGSTAKESTKKTAEPATGGGVGSGTKNSAAREGLRKSLSNAGVLGVIGVASGKGAVSDIFSEGGAVAEGARPKRSGLALATDDTQIKRRNLLEPGTGGGGSSNGAASQNESGAGFVGTGNKREAEILGPKVTGHESNILSGSLDKKSISQAMGKKSSGFRRCYERGLKSNPDLAGKLVFEIMIGAEGQVQEVHFLEDGIKSAEVSDCIKGILMRMTFDKPASGSAVFRSALVFEAQQ